MQQYTVTVQHISPLHMKDPHSAVQMIGNKPSTWRRKMCSQLTKINNETMNKQEHVSEYMVQTCINSSLNDLS